MGKIGRNDPCPCASGKKHKKCCGSPTASAAAPSSPVAVRQVSFEEIPESVRIKLFTQQIKESERVKKYGHARPPIAMDFQGQKVVAIGNKLMWAKQWKTFPDFLFTYIAGILGAEWGNAEIKKPYEDRHPILQWYQQLCEFQRAHLKADGEIHQAVASGPVMAYLALAYDLYTLEHHSLLQERLIQRLKHKDQFQGARYETFVATAFIRAGFDVRLEDETDQPLRVRRYLQGHRCCIRGGSEEPPPRGLSRHAWNWIKRVAEQVHQLDEGQGDKPYPPAFVFFTNHPYHYFGNDRPEPGRTAVFTAINMPEFRPEAAATPAEAMKRAVSKHRAVMALYESVTTHTEVPHSLE